MTNQESLNQLLQWSIENSSSIQNNDTSTTTTSSSSQPRDPARGLNADMLAQLLGGPSDADLMRESMAAILAPIEQVSRENKMVAWDNMEQLIEQIDNANNLASLGLWPPLVQQLDHEEAEMRRMAAWCCSTAVQNNIKAQETMLETGAIVTLARLAQEDPEMAVRKKAITALSSEVRNFQPGMDELAKALRMGKGVDAADMEAVSEVIDGLRERSAARV